MSELNDEDEIKVNLTVGIDLKNYIQKLAFKNADSMSFAKNN